MKLKLRRIGLQPFVIMVSMIHVVAGFLLGTVVTIVSVTVPDDQGMAGIGGWAILVFPMLNGILGCVTALTLGGIYNFFAGYFGGLVLEFEENTGIQ